MTDQQVAKAPDPAHATEDSESPRQQALWASVVFLAAIALTGIYESIAHGTYDFDEFVYLLLGRGVAAGKLPYRDFLFFHPPGILILMSWLEPLIHNSWAWGRSVSILLSAITCALVYLAARRFLPRSEAVVAGLLGACSPIMLASGTRIVPDVYIMFFSFLGVYLLLVAHERSRDVSRRDASEGTGGSPGTKHTQQALGYLVHVARSMFKLHEADGSVDWRAWILALAAGISFGVGIWFKYPTVLFLPAALLLARRRSVLFLAATAVTAIALFAPYLSSFTHLYQDTVVYQQSRFVYPLGIRFLSILLFAVVLQPLAVFGLFVLGRSQFVYTTAGQGARSSPPNRSRLGQAGWWLVAGYGAAFLFLASSQVYYHYLLPVVPYGAILGALYVSRLRLRRGVLLLGAAACSVAVTLVWAVIMTYTPGNYPFHITSAQTANVGPVSRYIQARVSAAEEILDDQPDLPVLAYRSNCDNYFWSDASVITHSQLQFCLLHVRYVVHFFGSGSGFPPGFLYRADDNSGIPPGAIDDKFLRTGVGSGSYGAFVYDTQEDKPYVPPRG